MQSPIRISLSVSLMRGLGCAGGAVCCGGMVLVRDSAGVGGVVCCARLTVAAASAAKATAARFTVRLLSLQTAETRHLPPTEAPCNTPYHYTAVRTAATQDAHAAVVQLAFSMLRPPGRAGCGCCQAEAAGVPQHSQRRHLRASSSVAPSLSATCSRSLTATRRSSFFCGHRARLAPGCAAHHESDM